MGINDELSGQAVNAFVSLKEGNETTDQVKKDLVMQVRKSIGPFAAPKAIFIVDDLPKTRSGKIMRRILRKILAGEEDQLGDTSTVSDGKCSYTMPVLTVLVALGPKRGRQDHRDCSGITKKIGRSMWKVYPVPNAYFLTMTPRFRQRWRCMLKLQLTNTKDSKSICLMQK